MNLICVLIVLRYGLNRIWSGPLSAVSHPVIVTRLERCTLWSTLRFQRCSSRHIKGGDVTGCFVDGHSSKELWARSLLFETSDKGNNAIHCQCCDNAIQGHCWLIMTVVPTAVTMNPNNDLGTPLSQQWLRFLMSRNNDFGYQCCATMFQYNAPWTCVMPTS
jgi:hypothetical protein